MSEFVYFNGDETEKEFLQKCLRQWETLSENDSMFKLGALFSEIRHRIMKLEDLEDAEWEQK